MSWIDWYDKLAKPSWTPQPSTIALIWAILYPMIVLSFGFIFVKAARGRIRTAVALPFVINLAANLLFMPFFRWLSDIPLAAVDIVIVWLTIIWCMLASWPCFRWVAMIQIPYFIWVSIATVIQLWIFWNND